MCCRDYNATVFAAIFSIVQSLLHMGFCIWGTNLHLCKDVIHTGTFRYLFYLTYFYSSSCLNTSVTDLSFDRSFKAYILIPTEIDQEQNSTIQRTNKDLVNLRFPTESWVAERTFNIMIAFIIIDSLWIITAIALLIGVYCQIKQFLSMIFYFPWICVLLVVIFFDSISAIWFGMDISSTYGLKNWFIFIGGKQQEGIEELSNKYVGPLTSVPSIIMTTIFSRLFIIWFINLFLLLRITQAAINAFDDFDDEASNASSKVNNVDVVTSISVDNQICSRNFQVRHINPILLELRRRRSEIRYGSDDDDDDDIETVRKYKRKMKIQKLVDQLPSCSNFQTHNEKMKLSNLNKPDKVQDDKYLKVVVGYEGDRSSSPSPVHNSKQTFNFSSKYTSSYVIHISNKSSPI